MARPNVFICYSHRDQRILRGFLPYLELLERQNFVEIRTDTELKGGDRWREEIEAALNSAKVAFLLISQPFLSSRFIYEEELPRIFRRESEGKLTVLPVYLSPSTVSSASISFTDNDGIKRDVALSAFQGFGTPDRTIKELAPSARDRLFLKLHDRIKDLAAPASPTPLASSAKSVSAISAQPLSGGEGTEAPSIATIGATLARRLPVYFLIDCSASLAGTPIESIKQGIRELHSNLMDVPSAIETAYLSVITFGGTARQIVPLTELALFMPPDLTAKGTRCLGAALKLLIECIGREVRKKEVGVLRDFKPLIFLLTDGEPTDQWREYAEKLRQNPPGSIIAVICGEAKSDFLKLITDTVLMMKDMTPDGFAGFFKWEEPDD